ncbi:MAG: PKD domain-containing protein [Bacteroidetes bacterium]|nr:PKD domain-containing protein [Bacteroidota bacterium]
MRTKLFFISALFCCSGISANAQTCTANFTYIDSGLTVMFMNTSTGSPNLFYWTFGDGQFSIQENPVYSYSSSGSYVVCFNISDGIFCNDTYCDTITVFGTAACTSSFTFSVDSLDPMTIHFTDSSFNASEWTWDFGDFSGSTQQNPSQTYSFAGSYYVCLTIKDSTGMCSDQYCEMVTVSGGGPNCNANFWYIPDTANPMIIYFTDFSMNATDWFWDFGDGNTSTLQNPSNTYPAPGTYNACLTIFDSTTSCSDTVCQPVFIDACYAGYSYSANNLTISFTDMSSGSPNSWYWDFGDSTTSTQQNPVHTFPAQGNYWVCLTISDGGACNNTFCNWVFVPGQSMCEAGFTYSIYDFFGTLFADFNDTSTGGPTTWYWDFGDGQFSTSQNPLPHQYDSAGLYNVCLTISDSAGFCFDMYCDSIYVGICNNPCTAAFTYSDSGNVVYFANQSTGGCATNQWDFGDGSFPDFTANPSHTYANVDTYLVCLSVSDPFGPCPSDSSCTMIIIDSITVSNCPDTCKADFTFTIDNTTASFTNLSTGACTTNQWDFGDGSFPDFTGNPTHIYDSAGMYMVCLTVSELFGPCPSDSSCQMVNIPPSTGNCSAGFWYTVSGTSAFFLDISTGNPVSWAWDFGVPFIGSDTSSQQDPTYNFPYSGTFTVCLSIDDGLGCYDTYCLDVVVQSCKADFSYFVEDGTVTLTDNSTYANTATYNWTFGDGNTSQSDSSVVIHTYDNSGTYEICLTIFDAIALCTDTYCDSVSVIVIGIEELRPDKYRDSDFKLRIYPNPNNGIFKIRIPDDMYRIRELSLSIVNVLGQEVYKSEIPPIAIGAKSLPIRQAGEISIGSMQPGIYKVILSGDGILSGALLVIE